MGMRTTDYETWREIGDQAMAAHGELRALMELLAGDVPKSVWNQEFARADAALSELRSELEERLAEEHPEEWETSVFYGDE